jgi:hypothetical protein
VSDESNEPVLDGQSVHLRVSRSADVFAFHFSSDVERWRLSRLFRLRDPSAPTAVGFLAQSPTGDGCEVRFDQIRHAPDGLVDPRDIGEPPAAQRVRPPPREAAVSGTIAATRSVEPIRWDQDRARSS